ncbi:MAG TPA: diacylglycerol kinase [Erysipelotrichaceae bacterium]|nr:diacylglycerol kinase [Erysipelotrichaceae bacterium]
MGLRNDVKQRLKNKFSAAFVGIWVGITTDRSIKFQWIIGLLVTGVFAYLRISISDWLWVVACITSVITLEHLNSAIEELADFVWMDTHIHIKRIKDFAAAGVFIASIGSAIIGLLIFIKYI